MVLEGTSDLSVAIQYGSAGQVRVKLAGELDIASLSRVRGLLYAVIEDRTRVAVDLRELRFLDLPGLRLLVELTASAAHRGGRMELRGDCGQVARVIDLTRARPALQFA